MMKQWQINKFGLSNLQLGEAAIPRPGPQELLVRISAVSLNYRDKLVVDGIYSPELPLPFIPGSDAVGKVVAVGENVTRFQVEDRVVTHLFQQWLDGPVRTAEQSATLGCPLPGVLAEYVVLPEDGAVAVPAYLSDNEASTLPIAALTAWWSLFEMNPIKPGETVLVQGTGGVSLFALQLGAAFGARVIVTSSSEEKLDRVKAMGAWKTINYKQRPDWDREVLALTNGKGVSRILEMAGGDEVQRSMNALANGGQMVLIGFLQGTFLKIDILPFLMKGGAIHGVSVGHRKAFEAMNAALAMDEIHPVIDGVYSFEQTPSAFTHLGRGAFGKIVIEFPK